MPTPLFAECLYESHVRDDGVRGIYPDFLTLTAEQDSVRSVSFLDVSIVFDHDRWFTTIYDKREHPPLSRVNSLKYPHVSCFLSDRSKYGIITSRLHAFSRVCQRKCDFIARSRIFLRAFRARGYSAARIRSFVMRFLKTVAIPYAFRSRHALMRAMMA